MRKCDDMPIITTDEIQKMLDKENKDRKISEKLLDMSPLLSSNDEATAEKATLKAAALLGLLPDSEDGLYT